MGLLQTAGVVSGMGAGLSEGLKQMQTGLTHWGLQEEDRKFQSEKLAQQMQHAERLQDKQISAQSAEGDKTREAHTADSIATRASHSADTQAQIDANVEIHGKDRQSQKEIAAAHDAATTAIHAADRVLKEKEIDLVSTTSTQTAKVKALTEVGNEITRLSVIIKDPMIDKAGPEYKNLVERMGRLTNLHDSYTRSLNLGAPPAEPVKERPPFQNQLAAPTPKSTRPPVVKPTVPTGLFEADQTPYDPKTGSMMQDLR